MPSDFLAISCTIYSRHFTGYRKRLLNLVNASRGIWAPVRNREIFWLNNKAFYIQSPENDSFQDIKIASSSKDSFCATDFNRKRTSYILGHSSRKVRANRLYRPEKRHLVRQFWYCQGLLKWKRPQSQLTCVAQKRLCLSSLMLNAGTSGPPDKVLEDGDSQDVAWKPSLCTIHPLMWNSADHLKQRKCEWNWDRKFIERR